MSSSTYRTNIYSKDYAEHNKNTKRCQTTYYANNGKRRKTPGAQQAERARQRNLSTFAHVDDYDEHVSKDPGVQLHRTPEAKHSSKNRDRSSRRAQVTPSGITSITNDLGILRKEQQCPSRGQTSSKRKRSPASESEDYGPTSFRSSTPERETFEPQILPQASVILPQQSAKHNKGIHLSDPDVRKLLFRNVPDTMDDQTGDGYLSEQELSKKRKLSLNSPHSSKYADQFLKDGYEDESSVDKAGSTTDEEVARKLDRELNGARRPPVGEEFAWKLDSELNGDKRSPHFAPYGNHNADISAPSWGKSGVVSVEPGDHGGQWHNLYQVSFPDEPSGLLPDVDTDHSETPSADNRPCPGGEAGWGVPSELLLMESTTPSSTETAKIHLDDQIDGAASSESASRMTPPLLRTLRILDNELVTPPEGWPFPDYDPCQPFPGFGALSANIRQRIMRYALPSLGKCFVPETGRKTIRPFYNEGSVHLTLNEHESLEVQNIDTTFLYMGDELWFNDALDVLYGTNEFFFDNPKLFHWWIKRIGNNVGRLRRLLHQFTTGPVAGARDMGTYNDLLWAKALEDFKSLQNLSSIHLDFKKWTRSRTIAQFTDDHESEKDWNWRNILRWREEIILCLMSYRGIAKKTVMLYMNSREVLEWCKDKSSDMPEASGRTVVTPGDILIKEGWFHRTGPWHGADVGTDIWRRLKAAMSKEPGTVDETQATFTECVRREREVQGVGISRGMKFGRRKSEHRPIVRSVEDLGAEGARRSGRDEVAEEQESQSAKAAGPVGDIEDGEAERGGETSKKTRSASSGAVGQALGGEGEGSTEKTQGAAEDGYGGAGNLNVPNEGRGEERKGG